MRLDVIAVGDVLLDVEVAGTAAPGEQRHTDVQVRAGGSAVNAALSVAARGGRALVVGRVGGDYAASVVRDTLADAGVGAALAVDAAAPTGTAVAFADSVHANPGASARLAPADVPAELAAGAVLVSGYTLLQDSSAAAGRAALERAQAAWVAVGAASPGLALRHGLDGLLGRAPEANVVFANEQEAEALTMLLPDAAVRTLARRVEVAVVTAGAAGAFAARGGESWHAPAAGTVRGHAFGAGDAFAGAFLLELARGSAVEDALRAAFTAA